MMLSNKNTRLALCLIASFAYLSALSAAQATPDPEQQSSQLLKPVQHAALQPGELIITTFPLDIVSRAENSYRSALTLLQRGAPQQAKDELQYALIQQTDHLPARELLVALLLEQHATQDAIEVLEAGVAVTPNHVKFPLWLSQLHLKLGAPERALLVLENTLIRFDQQADYLGALANLYLLNSRLSESYHYYAQAAQLAPQDGRWQLGLGMAAEALEDWSSAQGAYRRVQEYSFIDAVLLQFAQQRLTVINAQL